VKKLIILFFLILNTFVYSQNLEDKIRNSFCECIKTAYSKTEINVSCFENILNENETEIDSLFLELSIKENLIDSDDPYQAGYDAGYNYITSLFDKNIPYFFENCGSFYSRIVEARNEAIANIFIDCEDGKIEKMTKYIGQYEYNSDFIFDRGKCYFGIKKYELALNDFNDCLAVFPNDIAALYCKAITLEKLERFNEATETHKRIYLMTGQDVHKISFEIAKYLASKQE